MLTGPACLLVFAKVPRAGYVKTRLTPPLSPEWAARVYEAFLKDALDAYADQASGGDPLLMAEPVAVRLYLDIEPPADLAPEAVSVHRQMGDGLGSRMAGAFASAFASGYERVVVVGTDHPTLPLALMGEAFRQLREPMTCVLSPSDDGGYVFLGLNDLAPDLFDMPFSHERVFADTVDRALASGLTPVVLPGHYDVDDGEDLARLLREWRDGTHVGERTHRLLGELSKVLPEYLRGPSRP